jgi:outer membrane scaffolding protein for murein synthesis (MipA/OmpV family)
LGKVSGRFAHAMMRTRVSSSACADIARIVCCAAAVALTPSAAHAQVLQRIEQRVLDTLTAQLDKITTNDMELRLGAGPVFTAPDSAHSTWHPIVPLLSFRYKDWIALDETQLRGNLISEDSALGQAGFRAGPMLRLEFGRKRLNGDDINRLGAVGTSVELGGFASWGYGPARLRIRVRQDVAGGHDGTVMELDARTGLFRSGKLGVGIQLQADWSSRDYMRAYYGVTLAESVETHLPVYSPKAGFRDVMPSIAAQYQFNRHWAAVGTIQYIHLLGDAADSPVPRTRGAGGRTNVGAFVVYTF